MYALDFGRKNAHVCACVSVKAFFSLQPNHAILRGALTSVNQGRHADCLDGMDSCCDNLTPRKKWLRTTSNDRRVLFPARIGIRQPVARAMPPFSRLSPAAVTVTAAAVASVVSAAAVASAAATAAVASAAATAAVASAAATAAAAAVASAAATAATAAAAVAAAVASAAFAAAVASVVETCTCAAVPSMSHPPPVRCLILIAHVIPPFGSRRK